MDCPCPESGAGCSGQAPGVVSQLSAAAGTYRNRSIVAGKGRPPDLVQEALLKAHQHFDQFQGRTEAELAGWLRQILARCLADLVRKYRMAEARHIGRER